MRPLLFTCAFIILSCCSGVYAQNDCNIPINEKRILNEDNLDYFLTRFRTDSFSIGYKTSQIPTFIRKKFFCLVGKMANKGEEWNATDDILDESLPFRQLEFFGLNEKQDLFVVVYKKGGVGESTIVIMMRLTDQGIIADRQKNVADIWIGQCFFEGTTVSGLATFIRKNRRKKFGINTNAVFY